MEVGNLDAACPCGTKVAVRSAYTGMGLAPGETFTRRGRDLAPSVVCNPHSWALLTVLSGFL